MSQTASNCIASEGAPKLIAGRVIQEREASRVQYRAGRLFDLFRREAVEHATQRLTGEVVIVLPLSSKLLTLLIASIFASCVVFLTLSSFAQRETVPGWLTPVDGIVRATALRGGVLEELYVEEGDILEEGAPIARMRLSIQTLSGDAGNELLDLVSAQAAASERSLEAELSRLSEERVRLRRALQGAGDEERVLQSQRVLQRERVELAEAEASNAAEVADRGYLPRREVRRLEGEANSARQELARLDSALLRLRRERHDLQAEIAVLPFREESLRAEALAAEAVRRQRSATIASESAYVVQSPSVAKVAAIPVRPGAALGQQETIAALLPVAGELVAELYLPSRAIGFVSEGQEVNLRYDAFPFQRHGTAVGEVVEISDTVLAPEEVPIPGSRIDQPVFKVRVRLEQQTLTAYGREISLRPGMALSADIVIAQRSLFEWLFDPVFAAR